MDKDAIEISGEKFSALKGRLESMYEFAARMNIGLRTATELSKPGTHSLRIDTLNKIAKGLGMERNAAYEAMGGTGVNGQDAAPEPLPAWAAQYKTLEEAKAAIERAWNDPAVKKAAKKRGKP